MKNYYTLDTIGPSSPELDNRLQFVWGSDTSSGRFLPPLVLPSGAITINNNTLNVDFSSLFNDPRMTTGLYQIYAYDAVPIEDIIWVPIEKIDVYKTEIAVPYSYFTTIIDYTQQDALINWCIKPPSTATSTYSGLTSSYSILKDIQNPPSVVYKSDAKDDDQLVYIKLTDPIEAESGSFIILEHRLFEPVVFTFEKMFDITDTGVVEKQIVTRSFDPDWSSITPVNQISASISQNQTYLPFTGAIEYQLKYLDKDDDEIKANFQHFQDHVYFGSAVRTLDVAYSKLSTLYNLSTSLVAAVGALSASATQSVLDHYKTFTPYEKWLMWDGDGYPKSGPYSTSLLGPTNAIVTAWYSEAYTSASQYDSSNEAYIKYRVPEFYFDNTDRDDLMFVFVDMIGSYFDNVKLYTDNFGRLFNSKLNSYDHAPNRLLQKILTMLGVDVKNLFYVESLYNYLLGKSPADKDKEPLKDIMNQFYLRILNSIVYIYRTKGTKESIRALFNCFGVPSTIISAEEDDTVNFFTDTIACGSPKTTIGKVYQDTSFYALKFGDGCRTYVTGRFDTYITNDLASSASFTFETRLKVPSLYDQFSKTATHSLWCGNSIVVNGYTSSNSSLFLCYATNSFDATSSYDHKGTLVKHMFTQSMSIIENIPLRTDKFYNVYLKHNTCSISTSLFAGLSAYSSMSYQKSLSLDNNDILVELWGKFQTGSNAAIVCGQDVGTSGIHYYKFLYEPNGNIVWAFNSGDAMAPYAMATSSATIDNKYYCLQGVIQPFDPMSNVKVYTNGQQNAAVLNTAPFGNTMTCQPSGFRIGCSKSEIIRVRFFSFGLLGLTDTIRNAVITDSYDDFLHTVFNNEPTRTSSYQQYVKFDYDCTKPGNFKLDRSGVQNISLTDMNAGNNLTDSPVESEVMGIIEKDVRGIKNHYYIPIQIPHSMSKLIPNKILPLTWTFGSNPAAGTYTSSFLTGFVHEMMIYNDCLTNATLESHSLDFRYAAGNTTASTQKLVAWWRMNEKYNVNASVLGTASLSDASPWCNKFANFGYLRGFASGTSSFERQQETIYTDIPNFGGQVSEKIYIGKTTSSIHDTNKISVAFSPVKLIDQDIVATFFNQTPGQQFSKPMDRYSNTYSGLSEYKNFYFEKFGTSSIDWEKFFKLAKQINIVMFDYIDKIIPVRADLEKGVVIKNHILEAHRTKEHLSQLEVIGEEGNTGQVWELTANRGSQREDSCSPVRPMDDYRPVQKEDTTTINPNSVSGSKFYVHPPAGTPYYRVATTANGSGSIRDYYDVSVNQLDMGGGSLNSYKWSRMTTAHSQLRYATYVGSLKATITGVNEEVRITASAVGGGQLYVVKDYQNVNLKSNM